MQQVHLDLLTFHQGLDLDVVKCPTCSVFPEHIVVAGQWHCKHIYSAAEADASVEELLQKKYLE
jgi:hypothetical protein